MKYKIKYTVHCKNVSVFPHLIKHHIVHKQCAPTSNLQSEKSFQPPMCAKALLRHVPFKAGISLGQMDSAISPLTRVSSNVSI